MMSSGGRDEGAQQQMQQQQQILAPVPSAHGGQLITTELIQKVRTRR